jgi:hypothetical protein
MMRLFFLSLMVAFGTKLFGQQGPGGIGTNLAFWLDANSANFNYPVDLWPDRSGNNVATTVNGNPIFIPSILNGQGVVRFNGNSDEVSTNMSINAAAYDQLTVVAVYIPRVDHAGSIWGEDNQGWDRFMTDITLVDRLNLAVGAGYDPIDIYHPSTNIPNLFVTNVATLSTVVYDDDLFNGTHVYINGQLVRSFTSNAADYYEQYNGNGYSNFYVGAIGSSGYRFNGDIAEIIVFLDDISLTQRIIIENYLAAKYGQPLAGTVNVFDEDDLGYDFNVAGIGSLNGSIQNDSRGTGIVRIWNPSNLNDNEFLLWGDDNGALQANNTTDVASGVQARFNRSWKVSEVNTSGSPVDVGSVNISFVLENIGLINACDLRLLIDSDNDGTFADEIPIADAIDLGNNEYAFMGVASLANNLRFTLGTANAAQTPLPTEIKFFSARSNKGVVELTWETLVENDVLRFEIYRSMNGFDWESIASVPANGAGWYVHTDSKPIDGRSYYKLVSEDFDSSRKSVAVSTVQWASKDQLTAFPNPFKEKLTLGANVENISQIVLLNELGLDCTSDLHIIPKITGNIELNFCELPDGPYVIKVNNNRHVRVFKLSH